MHGNASVDLLNVINLIRFCLNLQAIWDNFAWPNNVTTWVEIAVQCRPLLAVPIRLHVSSRAETRET